MTQLTNFIEMATGLQRLKEEHANVAFCSNITIDFNVSFHAKRQHKYMGLDARKPVFGGLQTTKAQTSLRIRAV